MKNYIILIGVFLAIIVFQVAFSLLIIYLGGDYYIALFILVFFTLLAIALSYNLLRNKRKRTREEYALNLLANDVVLFGTFLAYINPSYFDKFIYKICVDFWGLDEFSTSRPDTLEIILVALVLIIILYFTHRVYFKWDGGVSISEIKRRDNTQNINIFILATDCILTSNARKLAKIVEEEKGQDFIIKPIDNSDTDWHIQAKELLRAKSKQYKIKDSDWHEVHKCYIASYGEKDIPLAIYCRLHEVSDSELLSFVEFVKFYNDNNKKIIYYFLVKDKKKSPRRIINSVYILVKDKQELIDNLMDDLEDYKESIIYKYEKESIIKGREFKLKDVYVEPACVIKNNNDKEADKRIDSIENYIINWVNETNDKKQLAILGDYGMGKSVLSLRIAYLLLNSKECNRTPIIIELSGMFPQGDEVTILSKFTNHKKIDPEELYQLHLAGRLLLIFDGFDEMVLAGEEEHRNDHFKRLWDFATPNSKIIITGRENYFLGEKEKKELLKLSYQSSLHLSYCEELDLCTFNETQIKLYMEPWPEPTKGEILKSYEEQKNGSFGDLISRPSSLYMAASIWNRLREHINDINSAAVIEEFLKDSYDRQEEKNFDIKEKKWKKDRNFLSSEERSYFMQGIALEAVSKNEYTNRIENNTINSCIKVLYDYFPNSITISENKGLPLLKKRGDEKTRLERIYKDVRTCGILVVDHANSNSLSFAHKSFLEFLVADFIAQKTIIQKGSVKYDKIYALDQSISVPMDTLYKNINVIKFVAELLVTRLKFDDCKDNYDKIKAIYNQLEIFKPYSLNIFLLVRLFDGIILCLIYFGKIAIPIMMFLVTTLIIIIVTLKGEYLYIKEFLLNVNIILIIILPILIFLTGILMYILNIKSNKKSKKTLFGIIEDLLFKSDNLLKLNTLYILPISFKRPLIIFYLVCQKTDLIKNLFEVLPIRFCSNLDRLVNIGPYKYLEFSYDYLTLLNCQSNYEGAVFIPHGIKEIGPKAFSHCEKINSVVIPESVSKIGDWAFNNCTGLTFIEITNGVSMIMRGAFSGCTSLKSIEIPNSVTKIGERTFENCTSLKSIEISNSLTEIGNYAFSGCTSLKSIEIPNSLNKIGDYAFSGCTSLKSIMIPDKVKEIGMCAFEGCTSLKSVMIQNSVISIRDYSFRGCTNLVEIHLRNKKPRDLSVSLQGLDFSKITLYVPKGTDNKYQNHPFYSKFGKIEIEEWDDENTLNRQAPNDHPDLFE